MQAPVKPTRHTIVVLEGHLISLPKDFELPGCTYKYIEYATTNVHQIESRIKEATIIVAVTLPLNAHHLSAYISPKLRMINYVASGVDGVDLTICLDRRISVCNAAGASAVAVSEHAIGLYFSLRRKLLQTHRAVQEDKWTERSILNSMMRDKGKLVRTCSEEVMGVIGYGPIGM